MAETDYEWRRLAPAQRMTLLARRREAGQPWHSPPHRASFDCDQFHITAACYEHRPHIGRTPDRMDAFSHALTTLFGDLNCRTYAWCVLPNHYHALIQTADVLQVLDALGRLHGRTSHAWNGAEQTRGRTVFFRAVDRAMRNERHFFATLNYVHHNPVHHGYARKWADWSWSSAAEYVEVTGTAEAARVWREYPVKSYGRGWDDAAM